MNDPMLPTDVSSREAELGYQLIQVFATLGFGSPGSLGWVYCVAKVILGTASRSMFTNDLVYVLHHWQIKLKIKNRGGRQSAMDS